jgi:universal stress protein A
MNEDEIRSSAREAASVSSSEPTKEAAPSATFLQLKKILVPLDFSQISEKAFRYAIKFAGQFGSSVTLLHVIQPMVYPADFGYPPTLVDSLDDTMQQAAKERLQAMASSAPIEMETIIRLGQPYHEITIAARELEVDLIIITTHGHTGLKHALLGSTAERVVRHAPCPVLTLREREHDFA